MAHRENLRGGGQELEDDVDRQAGTTSRSAVTARTASAFPDSICSPCSLVVSAVLALLPGGVAMGQDVVGLRGEMFIGGAQLVDPPAGEAKDTHAYLAITGSAALRLYRSMPTQEQADSCRGDGRRLKRAGELSCSIDAGGREAVCDFAVDLRSGKLAGGRPC